MSLVFFCRELNFWFGYWWKFIVDPKIDLLVSYFKQPRPTSPVRALFTAVKSITLPTAYRYEPTIHCSLSLTLNPPSGGLYGSQFLVDKLLEVHKCLKLKGIYQ
jgi:hypothetical protein